MTSSIGGYFELELHSGEQFHENALQLNTARNCFEYILRVRRYKKIYLPYFTCAVMLEPLMKLNIDYEFYSIDFNLEIIFSKVLLKDEALLYTNYFGLKQKTVVDLSKKYQNLIIDNSQAFFAPALKGVDTFYSARKFVGVPDGAYLYIDKYLEDKIEKDISYQRMSHLLKRIDLTAEDGYKDFILNDKSLNNQAIKRMSTLTQRILNSINYEYVKERRISNFIFFHKHLKQTNEFSFKVDSESIPMVYPYYTDNPSLKQTLISKKIYVATYWPNVMEWCDKDSLEYKISKNTIFLPIDQRYSHDDLEMILKTTMNEG